MCQRKYRGPTVHPRGSIPRGAFGCALVALWADGLPIGPCGSLCGAHSCICCGAACATLGSGGVAYGGWWGGGIIARRAVLQRIGPTWVLHGRPGGSVGRWAFLWPVGSGARGAVWVPCVNLWDLFCLQGGQGCILQNQVLCRTSFSIMKS